MTVEKRKALIIVYTGNGKGKTTAALGMLLRAWGRGMKVAMLSFMKNEDANFGEERAARRLGVEMVPMGKGFTWLSKDLSRDEAMARQAWAVSQSKIASGEYDIVILDEITYPINYGWLALEDVIEVLRHRPSNVHVVLTGRDAPQGLIDFADLVTEMREVKHPFQAGIKAQPGVDF